MESTASICGALHSALEGRNADAMLELFAEDAELKIVDRNHPPSHPMDLHGKSEIGGYLRDVLGRDMTHHITSEIVGDSDFAFTEECEYPDGKRVFTNAFVELRNGKIFREVEVQAWDE